MSKTTYQNNYLKSDIFLKKSGILAISSILKFFSQFVIIILASRKLDLEQYGTYQSFWMYLNIFNVISLFGINNLSLSTSLSELLFWIKKFKKILILSTLFLNLIFITLLFFSKNYFNSTSVILILILLFFQNIAQVSEVFAIKKEKLFKVFFSNIIYTILFVIANVYSFYYVYSFNVLLVLIIIITVFKIPILFDKTKSIKFVNTNNNTNISKQWLYLGLNDVLGIFVKWIDKYIVLLLLPASQFAIYFNGTFEIPIFLLLLSAVGNISLVELSKNVNINVEVVKTIFNKSSLILASIAFPSFFFLMFYCDKLFLLLLGYKYLLSIPIFKISLLIIPVRIVYSTVLLQVYNKSNLILKGSILDLITSIIFMLMLYPIMRINGLVLSFVIATYIQVGYYIWHTCKLLNINIYYLFNFPKLIIIFFTSFICIGFLKYCTEKINNDLSALVCGCSFFLIILSIFILLVSFYWIKDKNYKNEVEV